EGRSASVCTKIGAANGRSADCGGGGQSEDGIGCKRGERFFSGRKGPNHLVFGTDPRNPAFPIGGVRVSVGRGEASVFQRDWKDDGHRRTNYSRRGPASEIASRWRGVVMGLDIRPARGRRFHASGIIVSTRAFARASHTGKGEVFDNLR